MSGEMECTMYLSFIFSGKYAPCTKQYDKLYSIAQDHIIIIIPI